MKQCMLSQFVYDIVLDKNIHLSRNILPIVHTFLVSYFGLKKEKKKRF